MSQSAQRSEAWALNTRCPSHKIGNIADVTEHQHGIRSGQQHDGVEHNCCEAQVRLGKKFSQNPFAPSHTLATLRVRPHQYHVLRGARALDWRTLHFDTAQRPFDADSALVRRVLWTRSAAWRSMHRSCSPARWRQARGGRPRMLRSAQDSSCTSERKCMACPL